MIKLTIVANKSKQAWAAQLQTGTQQKIAGTVAQSGATVHALLAIALTTALRGVNTAYAKKQAKFDGKTKATLVIKCADRAFVESVKGRMQGQKSARLAVGRNLLHPLYQQLARFDVIFADRNVDNCACDRLREWSRDALNVFGCDPIFAPSVVAVSSTKID
jgi:hypothetical protein